MLGLGADRLWADMNRLLAFLFHQVLPISFLSLHYHTSNIYSYFLSFNVVHFALIISGLEEDDRFITKSALRFVLVGQSKCWF